MINNNISSVNITKQNKKTPYTVTVNNKEVNDTKSNKKSSNESSGCLATDVHNKLQKIYKHVER